MNPKLLNRLTALLLSAALLLTLSACGGGGEEDSQPVEVMVFAAASLTETLTELGAKYEEAHDGVKILFNFDSSGTLKTAIQQIAENQGDEGQDSYCDLFLSAGQKQMNQMDAANTEENTEGLDLVQEGSRINLLENQVVLVVPEGNPQGIHSFDELAARLEEGSALLAMGNSDVPVGQYTQKILAYYGLNEEELAGEKHCISYGSNVKEVTTQVKEGGAVSCGIVYCTDAFSAGLTVVDQATAEMCGQVIYPAAVMKSARYPEEAQAFLDYLTTEEAMAVFEAVGFVPAA